MSTVTETAEKLLTFARMIWRAQSIRDAQTDTVADFVGCEVIDEALNGSYAVAIITHVKWDDSVLAPGGKNGDWMIGIRYIADGSQTWVNQTALTLTGTKYQNIDAVVTLHPLYESAWGKQS